jgi:predicted nucleic acid-binding protein
MLTKFSFLLNCFLAELFGAVYIPEAVANEVNVAFSDCGEWRESLEGGRIIIQPGRIIAQSNNLPITGTLGILLKAKKTGLVSSVKPLIDELRTEHNFWVRDDMYQKVLYIAREKT